MDEQQELVRTLGEFIPFIRYTTVITALLNEP